MRDIKMVLDRWGGWAASDSSGVDYSPIAAGFKGLLPQTGKSRLSCTDDDALIIEGCLARLQKRKPYEHSLLVAHYLYGISKRKIAKARKKDEKLIRIEIQMAEGFIEGCLSIIDAKLDLDW
ncbi:TPA: antitermination protein Q [Enterobacter hormaechei subsp. steigerwaltii]|uniref:antiterminator Q family protein n=1 Tax=Enterobacter cloacae complex TaxID=354276 RepID=UPI0022EC8F4F|nr:antiterminator Q family protein [Enterobacter hormaechei]HAV1699059.1 antitermination protein Q [Enterobacter hormaechei subsp. steigerwaltii]EHF4942231.1 antitermination protein Q [Enterobacter hormaechei]EHF5009145.1 antitermination protein Q [Enterobacter hormaechei]ELC6302975.1 antitermination protein Q [Enterobacter hormaechei]WBT25828.1 antiterminator Q family protein [Enterobacter hormaechei]